ncbi:MAG: hypothetical protein H6828_12940 [Planctomycetes bacterium]|nr:hypothetical protein [Planctomycetota bacterium]
MTPRLVLALVLAAAALAVCVTTCGERRAEGLELPAPAQLSEPAPGELAPAPAAAAEPLARDEAAARELEPAEEPGAADPYPPLPEDPVELGACALELHLVDDETGAPVAGGVQLWRLRAPETHGWSAGDQRQAAEHVPSEGFTFEALPAGEYRVVHLGDAPDAPDPPAFWVNGALTVHTLRVHPAEKRVVFLELRDLGGARLETIDVRRGHSSASEREPATPEWVRARAPKREGWGWGGGGAGGSYSSSHRSWRTLTAGPRGFELGEVQASDRDTERTQTFRLRDASGAEVDLDVGPLPAANGRLLATFVGEDDALANVRLPDGGDARGWEETHWVKLHPAVADDAHPGADFGDTLVEVVLYDRRATPLHVAWRLGQGFAPVVLDAEER